MTLRIGFDLDGVLADFAAAFRAIELRLFGSASSLLIEPPEIAADQEERARSGTAAARRPQEMRRRRDAVWGVIRETPDFWTTLKPLSDAAVPRIHEMMTRSGWEVLFIARRPPTAGDTVQRQSQRWLRDRGFDLPSVVGPGGSRAAAAAALRLHYYVDDSAQNCLDVASGSPARPILIAPERDAITENSARRLRISVARSIGEALDILAAAPADPTSLGRTSRIGNWT